MVKIQSNAATRYLLMSNEGDVHIKLLCTTFHRGFIVLDLPVTGTRDQGAKSVHA